MLRYPKHPGAIILRLPHIFTAEEINGRLRRFLSSASEEDIRNAIIIVELEKYRKRPIE